jgi:DNA-binding IclR family transcriptional regulator
MGRRVTDEITTQPPSDLIQSVWRALGILETVGSSQGLKTTEIAAKCGMLRDTAIHLINTLAHGRYLTRRDDGRWVLGPAVTARADERATQPQDAPDRSRG